VPIGFLSESQTREYGRFPGELTPDQLARYFHLDDVDRGFVTTHRGDHNRLGVAVQLGSLRMLGIFLEDPSVFRTPPLISSHASFHFPIRRD
jgi:hypothetical protein